MLAEALAEYKEASSSKTTRCAVGSWRETLSPKDQEEFDTVLTSNIPSITLLNIVQSVGAKFGITVFRNHRNKACACQN